MIPVTTPTFILTLRDADGYLEKTKSLRIDIRQQDVLISKDNTDNNVVIDLESNSVCVTLTQKESAKFLYKKG